MGSTLQIILDVSKTKYETAANFAAYPENSQEDVEKFATVFNINLKRIFKWESNKEYTGRQKDTPFPLDSKKGITVREALTKFIDFKGPLSKKLLKELVRYCRSLDDREKCE